jgi:hypothetical protein
VSRLRPAPRRGRAGRLDLAGGATWPDPEAVEDLRWRLRYDPAAVTERDCAAAAEIIATYVHILTHPAGTESVIRQVRQARRVLRERA